MSPRFDPERSLGFLINDVSRLLRRNFDRRVQKLGLTQAQWRAIAQLSRNEGMTQVKLAECLEIQPITLARLVDRMQAAGWVERRSHPADRRAVQLYLTAKSQPVLDEMYELAADTLAEAVAGLSTGAQKVLLETLRRVKQNLVAVESAADPEATPRTNKDVGRKPAKLRRVR